MPNCRRLKWGCGAARQNARSIYFHCTTHPTRGKERLNWFFVYELAHKHLTRGIFIVINTKYGCMTLLFGKPAIRNASSIWTPPVPPLQLTNKMNNWPKILLGFLAEKLISPNLSSFGRLLMLLCFYFLHCRFSVSNLKLFLTLSPLGFLAVSLSLSFNFFQRTSIYLPSCWETNEQSFQYWSRLNSYCSCRNAI